jgi:hypothetical protein
LLRRFLRNCHKGLNSLLATPLFNAIERLSRQLACVYWPQDGFSFSAPEKIENQDSIVVSGESIRTPANKTVKLASVARPSEEGHASL